MSHLFTEPLLRSIHWYVLISCLLSGNNMPLFSGEPVGTAVLAEFSRRQILERWQFKQTEGEIQKNSIKTTASTMHIHFPRWHLGRGKWPAAILDFRDGGFSLSDWQPYQYLVFEVFNHSAATAELKLRLDDVNGQRAVRVFSLPAEQITQCKITLAALGDEIDTANIVHLNLYMSQPAIDYTLELGELTLVAEALELPNMQFMLDPFSGGQVQVFGRLSRRAWIELAVLDMANKEVMRYQLFSDRIQWHQQANLMPGRYKIVLAVSDLDWLGVGIHQQLGDFTVIAEEERSQVLAWSESTTRKVMLHSRPLDGQIIAFWDTTAVEQQGKPLYLAMAQNEYEGVQVIFLNRLKDATFTFAIENLNHHVSDIPFPLEKSLVYQVGYVQTQTPGIYPVDFVGWWPDPLLVTDTFQAKVNECMPVWIQLKSTQVTEPGEYRGRLGIWRNGSRLGSLPLHVRVYNVALPDTTTVKTAFSFYPDMLKQIYDTDTAVQLEGQYHEFISNHRLNLTHLYRRSPPDTNTVMALLEQQRLNAFNLLYIPSDVYSSRELAQMAAKIEPSVAILRRRGLTQRAYIYGFDEANPRDFKELQRTFGFFKERFPDIRTMTTARDPSFGVHSGLDKVVDIWVPLVPAYDLALAQAARERGREVWWYICVAPAHPYANWFIEYPALEARLLWWMSYQNKVPGFLYYTANRWINQHEPMRVLNGNKTNWNPASYKTANGDGSLFYGDVKGPVTTLRLENIRDGIEDYELLHLLDKRLSDQGITSQQFCDQLIVSPTEFKDIPEHFSAVREQLLRTLEATADTLRNKIK